ncbi:unnamed protein product [Adineta ricciae]|uniref:Uncharacterized protein n=1 Tax=Adineta ricciae TaxID=249248 RepID=A0A814B7V2_ADIRI|nr:unnamed protein product [Adineta ricciae]CAF1077611.1 unnamed protein product [Adineta ricciae]
MGTGSSKTRVLPFSHPQHTVSGADFYWACRNGNLQVAKNIYPHLTYEQLNEVQPNGSTALHDACARNHIHVVKFLLEIGCSRTTLNSQHQTAYEVASPEIRKLFKRPPSERFVQQHAGALVKNNSFNNAKDDELETPDDWVTGRTSDYSTYEAQFMLALGQSNSVFKNIVKKRLERNHNEELLKLFNKSIPPTHNNYNEAKWGIEKFFQKLGVQHLIILYTMETDFYKNLKDEADALTAVLYLNLHELRNRSFTGRSYRGAIMTQNDLDAYRWASQKKESWRTHILETRILQSTSTEKSVALDFLGGQRDSNHFSVLIEFEFSNHCPTAINLSKLSEQLPCLSQYENENEVLVLPFTLFTLRDFKENDTDADYRIILQYYPTPKRSLRKAASESENFFI